MLGEFWGREVPAIAFLPFHAHTGILRSPPAARAGFPTDTGLHSQWHFELEMGCVALAFANPRESGAGCVSPNRSGMRAAGSRGCELCQELPAL